MLLESVQWRNANRLDCESLWHRSCAVQDGSTLDGFEEEKSEGVLVLAPTSYETLAYLEHQCVQSGRSMVHRIRIQHRDCRRCISISHSFTIEPHVRLGGRFLKQGLCLAALSERNDGTVELGLGGLALLLGRLCSVDGIAHHVLRAWTRHELCCYRHHCKRILSH